MGYIINITTTKENNMEVGSLVKHWRTKETGVIVNKKDYKMPHYDEWEVVWVDGESGFYSSCRLVEVVCK